MKQIKWLRHVVSGLVFTALGVAAAIAQTAITITQVDPSNFPEMVVYMSIDDGSGSTLSSLTKEMFVVTEDGQPTQVIDFVGAEQIRPVDIVFAFDTTGSMFDEIQGVKNTAIRFATQLRENGRDFRLGLVTYGDAVRGVYSSDLSLTADEEEFRRWVSRLLPLGGGDEPEISLDALSRATQMQFRPDAQKVLILITDAPPHEVGDGTDFSSIVPDELATDLYKQGFTVYAVVPDHPHYRGVVDATSGQFFDISIESDFTGIIDRLGGIIAAQYRLTYISPRPANDGTRRAIVIEVGGQTIADEYLEPHLVNVESDLVVGLILLAPLLMSIAIPWSIGQWRSRKETTHRPQPAPYTSVQARHVPPVEPSIPVQERAVALTCAKCGAPVRAGAKFCGRCGQPSVTVSPSATVVPARCPRCGQPTLSDSKFCGHCGQPVL